MALAFLGKIFCFIDVQQLVAIVAGVNALAIIFFFPETQYYREAANDPVLMPGTSTEKEPEATTVDPPETANRSYFTVGLRLWSGINPGIDKNTSLINLFLRPWPLVVYPSAIYSFMVFSVLLGGLIAIAATVASIFQSPPYNMSPGIQGLAFYIPVIIGVILGAFWGGALSDHYVAWRTRKNNGIFEPEVRLHLMILPLFITPAGLLMCVLGVRADVGMDSAYCVLQIGRFHLSDVALWGSVSVVCRQSR